MHRDKHRLNLKFVLILGSSIFLIGLLSIMFNSNFNNNSNQDDVYIPEEVTQVQEDTLSIKENVEPYLGDIHFQIGVGNKDDLIIYLNKKEVFNSNTNPNKDVFQIQVFDSTNKGENLFEIKYKEEDDGQPLVLFVIKDGIETVLNWEPKDALGTDVIKLKIE